MVKLSEKLKSQIFLIPLATSIILSGITYYLVVSQKVTAEMLFNIDNVQNYFVLIFLAVFAFSSLFTAIYFLFTPGIFVKRDVEDPTKGVRVYKLSEVNKINSLPYLYGGLLFITFGSLFGYVFWQIYEGKTDIVMNSGNKESAIIFILLGIAFALAGLVSLFQFFKTEK